MRCYERATQRIMVGWRGGAGNWRVERRMVKAVSAGMLIMVRGKEDTDDFVLQKYKQAVMQSSPVYCRQLYRVF